MESSPQKNKITVYHQLALGLLFCGFILPLIYEQCVQAENKGYVRLSSASSPHQTEPAKTEPAGKLDEVMQLAVAVVGIGSHGCSGWFNSLGVSRS